jgi:hypothetical protein
MIPELKVPFLHENALAEPRGTRRRGWYVGWRLAVQLRDRRVRR